ncbi:MAG: MarR family transcriptional regulator [Propionibacteriaceae bacterium]|nr:MarR family transcriptional regulator [Propionibacteriaceae bacterium]
MALAKPQLPEFVAAVRRWKPIQRRWPPELVNDEPFGLSGAEGDVMFQLLSADAPVPQNQFGELLDVGKAAVSRTLGTLEDKAYVVRLRPHGDRRTYTVTLTEKARQAAAAIQRAYLDLYATSAAGVSRSERRTLLASVVMSSPAPGRRFRLDYWTLLDTTGGLHPAQRRTGRDRRRLGHLPRGPPRRPA